MALRRAVYEWLSQNHDLIGRTSHLIQRNHVSSDLSICRPKKPGLNEYFLLWNRISLCYSVPWEVSVPFFFNIICLLPLKHKIIFLKIRKTISLFKTRRDYYYFIFPSIEQMCQFITCFHMHYTFRLEIKRSRIEKILYFMGTVHKIVKHGFKCVITSLLNSPWMPNI